MTQHTFARFIGHTMAVLPRSPFKAIRKGDTLEIEHFAPGKTVFAILIPDHGGYRSKIDQHTKSLYEVMDIDMGPDISEWLVETTIYHCAWPEGFEVRSPNDPLDPVLFYFVGPEEATMFIRDGVNAPPLAGMAAPNQKLMKLETNNVVLSYSLNGKEWRQRHYLTYLREHPFIVTLQAQVSGYERCLQAMDQVLSTLNIGIYPK